MRKLSFQDARSLLVGSDTSWSQWLLWTFTSQNLCVAAGCCVPWCSETSWHTSSQCSRTVPSA